eukprot:gene13922-19852_t
MASPCSVTHLLLCALTWSILYSCTLAGEDGAESELEGCETMDHGVMHGCKYGSMGSSILQGNIVWPHQDMNAPLVMKDFKELYRDNIDADFGYWEHLGRQLSMSDLAMPGLVLHPLSVLFVIKKNVVSILKNGRIQSYAETRVVGTLKNGGIQYYAETRADRMAFILQKVINSEANLTFPDTIFIYNSEDMPPCLRRGPPGGCTAPVFTIYKRWPGGPSQDTEVALPHFGRTFGELFNFPWEQKNEKALLRARLQRSMSAQSTRLKLSEMAAAIPEAEAVLDAGIVENRRRGEIAISKKARKSYVPIQQHTRWRFLLNTEGHVAPENQLKMKQIASTSQRFGYKYLSNHGKAMYTRQALLRYNALFRNMAYFMSKFNPNAGPGGSQTPIASALQKMRQSGSGRRRKKRKQQNNQL